MSFERGFSLIEVLVTAFVLATVTVAVTGLGMLSTRSAIESERQNVAQAIANEKIEEARTYSYVQIEFGDISPEGKITREEIVTRNDQEYTVYSYITLKDDPANGTLAQGTTLTAATADFKQLSVKVEWKRISGQQQSSTSSTVVAATFFANKVAESSCTPGAVECPGPDSCTPGTPASCPDAQGEFTIDCPPAGACEGDEPFAACPVSGDCSDVGTVSPPPEITPTPQPCSSSNDCGEDGQCTNSQCEPQWCQNIGIGGGTAEVCSLEGCNDLQDNDGDGGIDVNGRDNNNNGQFNDPVDTPPDPQCASIANEGGLYEWSGNCVRNNPSSTDCSGVEGGYEIAPTTTQCVLFNSCGQRRLVQRACSVPACQPESNKCESRRNCADNQTCVNPDCFQDSDCPAGQECNGGACAAFGKCSLGVPVCLNGNCFECTAANKESCADINPELCDKDFGGPNPPPAEGCTCYFATCAQCTSSRVNANLTPDQTCKNSFPNSDRDFCHFGKCVECALDQHCDVLNGPPPPGGVNKCINNNCSIEFAPPPVVPACRDTVDNDGDLLIDFGSDPGCSELNDATEDDVNPPLPTPPSFACSDGVDNDGDGKIDFPTDPGCTSQIDPDEFDVIPLPSPP